MYEHIFGIGVALALRFFEVRHHSLPEWVKGVEAVWLAVATVPITFLGNAHLPLLKDVSEETLLFCSTFYLFYLGKLLTIQLKRGECLLSLSAPVWLDALALIIPH